MQSIPGMPEPTLMRPHPGDSDGIQLIYFFPNGRGASVIRACGSYGAELGMFELAVLKVDDYERVHFHLDHSTPITDRVEGWLNPGDVCQVLSRIARLPKVEEAELE